MWVKRLRQVSYAKSMRTRERLLFADTGHRRAALLARGIAWKPIVGTAPELTSLVGKETFLREIHRAFEQEARAFRGRAYGAAAL
jgi:hypothetical protein